MKIGDKVKITTAPFNGWENGGLTGTIDNIKEGNASPYPFVVHCSDNRTRQFKEDELEVVVNS